MIPRNIAPLPHPTRSILRSTIILASLVQLVSELIQNSLDAQCQSIEIGVDCDDWSCFVQDDGHGISKDDLDVLAHPEQPSRYCTSKSHGADLVTLGFRGEGMLNRVHRLPAAELDNSLGVHRGSFYPRDILQDGKVASKLVDYPKSARFIHVSSFTCSFV